jgi:hypothetical protein
VSGNLCGCLQIEWEEDAELGTHAAPTFCAAILCPPNGSMLGVTEIFTWNAVQNATFQLDVSHSLGAPGCGDILGGANGITTSTSFTVNQIPCDGRTVYVQLVTIINSRPQPAGRYTYKACKMLYMWANPSSTTGGWIDLWVGAITPPSGNISGQLTVTESILEPLPPCLLNPFTHIVRCIGQDLPAVDGGGGTISRLQAKVKTAPIRFELNT